MTNSTAKNLTNGKIQQILVAVGMNQTSYDDEDIEFTQHNWNQARYFNSEQLKEIENFTTKLAEVIAEKFSMLYNADFNTTIASTTQHFAGDFSDSDSKENDYYLAFGDDPENYFALIGIPSQTALTWTAQLLGDAESEKTPDKDLSHLEKSLLMDIATNTINAFSNVYEHHNFHLAESIVRGGFPLDVESTKEFCKINFKAGKAGSKDGREAYFLISSDKLEPVIPKKMQTENAVSTEAISKMMLDYVHRTPLPVTAILACTTPRFEEIMGLQAGDILLLDKKINEPLELIVKNLPLYRGRLAKSDGMYAVFITEMCSIR